MYYFRAIDLIDPMIPIFHTETDIWDLVLRLYRVRKICASIHKIFPGGLARIYTVKDIAKELFVSGEESSVVTEISRLDDVLRRSMGYIARELPIIDPEAPLTYIIDLVINLGLECLPVAKEDILIGVISEESIIDNARVYVPLELRAEDIATKNVETIDLEAPLEEAIGLMLQRGFRRVPVKDQSDRIVGLLTILDIVAEIAEIFRSEKVLKSLDIFVKSLSQQREIMKKPTILSPDTSAREVIDHIVKSGVGCVLIGSEDTLSGIITERDIIRVIKKYSEVFE
ncbi:MAG: CBS domain-containing protein [Sulfolobales archaeon]